MTIDYASRIDALRRTKLEHTEEKIRIRGFMDIDDHGWIPWREPIPFKPRPSHPSGGCYGARCVGENFRAWLDVHPVYIHPMSALAGAWVGPVPGVAGWRPEDRPEHLAPLRPIPDLAERSFRNRAEAVFAVETQRAAGIQAAVGAEHPHQARAVAQVVGHRLGRGELALGAPRPENPECAAVEVVIGPAELLSR